MTVLPPGRRACERSEALSLIGSSPVLTYEARAPAEVGANDSCTALTNGRYQVIATVTVSEPSRTAAGSRQLLPANRTTSAVRIAPISSTGAARTIQPTPGHTAATRP